ncbi:C2 domain-containing protein [Streptomyces virginiae]|uniref:C2 domain-containing protein n=1 Tax=Streptomyces virginiae TaxID=1961 RepID=UPI00371C1B33
MRVTVAEARNLYTAGGLFERNDCYALVSIRGQQRQKTKVVKDAGDHAVWNETFEFAASDSPRELRLEVYDQDLLKDDLIGHTQVPLQSVFQQGSVEEWYHLGRGSKVRGEVRLRMEYVSN